LDTVYQTTFGVVTYNFYGVWGIFDSPYFRFEVIINIKRKGLSDLKHTVNSIINMTKPEV